ncbi:hypothetical protein ADL12_40325 [Streptomyces regalis]|uniref:Uncharacterized protein n=2 Tax=Streptomyces regalis TaxID=68262 RepID=A0A101JAP1_9ACTN|nr:hypothetical protein ADL12_40325 [Streptomyces regalis]
MTLHGMNSTASRQRCTGESYQSLQALLVAGEDACRIPAALPAQAELEAAIALRVAKMGGLSKHPWGIEKLVPRADQLNVDLLNEPYVVSYWAEMLLPRLVDDVCDVRDAISGVGGLRYRSSSSAVRLFRPGMVGSVLLKGFDPRWWERIARRIYEREPRTAVFVESDWSRRERAAGRASRESSVMDPAIASALLRRVRATCGLGEANGTDVWCSAIGHETFWTLEATDGPACSELAPLLTDGPTGLGWRVNTFNCLCEQGRDGCSVNMTAWDESVSVRYLNLRWGRLTITDQTRASIAEMNRMAFR